MNEGSSQLPPMKKEDVEKLLKASEDLMQTGLIFSEEVNTAMREFKTAFELSMKTHFMATAVAEMLSRSFEKMEQKVQTNLEGINNIYTEGGQWYSYYLGMALGRAASAPASKSSPEKHQAKAKAAS